MKDYIDSFENNLNVNEVSTLVGLHAWDLSYDELLKLLQELDNHLIYLKGSLAFLGQKKAIFKYFDNKNKKKLLNDIAEIRLNIGLVERLIATK